MTKPARQGFPEPDHDHARCLDATMLRAEAAFRDRGQKLTELRRDVLAEVAGSHRAVGAYEVLDQLARKRGRRLAPISVYRALDQLLAAGLVHRLESRNAFFACHSPHAPNPRQVVLACERCGAVAEVPGSDVFDRIAAAAGAAGFWSSRALVEVIGNCGRCGAGEADNA